MRWLARILFLALLFALPARAGGDGPPELPRSLDKKAREEIEGLLAAAFRAESDRARREVLEELRARDPVPGKELKGFRELCLEVVPPTPGFANQPQRFLAGHLGGLV